MRFAIERQHVVFAHGKEINILYDNHLAVFFLKLSPQQYFFGVYFVATCQCQHGLCHTFRSFQQTFTFGVFSQQGKYFLVVRHQFLHFLFRKVHQVRINHYSMGILICSRTIATSLNSPLSFSLRIATCASSMLLKSPMRHSQRGGWK